MTEGDVISSFNSTGSDPEGVAFFTGAMAVADPSISGIDLILPTGLIIGNIPKPEPKTRGITWDGVHFWVVVNSSQTLYEIDLLGNIISSFSIPISNPHGVTYDGVNFWITDSDNPIIHEMTKLGVVVSTITGVADMRDLTFVNPNLRVVDADDDTIQEMTKLGVVISSFATPGISPSGLGFDGTSLWHGTVIIPNGTIYQLEIENIPVDPIKKSISSDACINTKTQSDACINVKTQSDSCINNKITNNSCIVTNIQKDVCINTRIEKDVCL